MVENPNLGPGQLTRSVEKQIETLALGAVENKPHQHAMAAGKPGIVPQLLANYEMPRRFAFVGRRRKLAISKRTTRSPASADVQISTFSLNRSHLSLNPASGQVGAIPSAALAAVTILGSPASTSKDSSTRVDSVNLGSSGSKSRTIGEAEGHRQARSGG